MDYYLAPYVAKSYVKACGKFLETINIKEMDKLLPINKQVFISKYICEFTDIGRLNHEDFTSEEIKEHFIKPLMKYVEDKEHILTDEGRSLINDTFIKLMSTRFSNVDNQILRDKYNQMIKFADHQTERDTYQAMEALIHNLCTLASRAGSQVPFSNVNFGLDTSVEGRMVSKQFLLASDAGLGSGETAIFPISIFQFKYGVTDKGSPNYDLFKLACKVTSKRGFPNVVNDSATFNAKYYKEGHPETNVPSMGCRTRVIGNTYDPTHEVAPGRGNLFSITLNLPYLALEVKEQLGDKFDSMSHEERFAAFIPALEARQDLLFEQLEDRFAIISKRKAKNFPFMMGQHEYIGSENLGPEDEIGEVIKHGTLVTGYIGLAECLVVLFGKHHGESDESQQYGIQIIKRLNDRSTEKSQATHMNFSCMGSPAEGCCGRLLRLTRKRFGVIPGVTDHAFISNSAHCPVYFKTSIQHKVDIEAPYHELSPAGHIGYVEVDSDTAKNVDAVEAIFMYMIKKNMGYISINHEFNRDPVCGYVGAFPNNICPRCGRKEYEGVSVKKLLSLGKYQPDPQYAIKHSSSIEEQETVTNCLSSNIK